MNQVLNHIINITFTLKIQIYQSDKKGNNWVFIAVYLSDMIIQVWNPPLTSPSEIRYSDSNLSPIRVDKDRQKAGNWHGCSTNSCSLSKESKIQFTDIAIIQCQKYLCHRHWDEINKRWKEKWLTCLFAWFK